MGNCNKQFLRLKLKLKTLNQIPSLLSFNGNGNLKCPSRVFVAFIPQIVDSNWIYCLVSRVLPAAPVYLVPGFFLMFQKTRLNNGLVGRIPKMSDVVWLAGCPGLGSPLSAMTGVDEALQAGWPQGGAGVRCLGPSPPSPLRMPLKLSRWCPLGAGWWRAVLFVLKLRPCPWTVTFKGRGSFKDDDKLWSLAFGGTKPQIAITQFNKFGCFMKIFQ